MIETEEDRKKRFREAARKRSEEWNKKCDLIGEKLVLIEKKRKLEEEEKELKMLACFGIEPSQYAPWVKRNKSKLAKKEKRRTKKEKRRIKTKIDDDLLDDLILADDIETLKETAPKGLKGLSQAGLDYFSMLFKLIHMESNPNFPGHKGTGDKVSCFAKLSEMRYFIKNFDLVPLETYRVKNSPKHFPYTGKEYLQYVWTFSDMEKFKCFINSFSNINPSTEIMWLEDMIQSGNFIRIDDPSDPEYSFIFKSDEESKKKKEEFYKQKFPSGLPVFKKLSILVGSVAHKKKRVSNAKLIYTLNAECPGHSRINTGKLKLLFNYELQENFRLLGESVEGEKPQEPLKEKPQEPPKKKLQKKKGKK